MAQQHLTMQGKTHSGFPLIKKQNRFLIPLSPFPEDQTSISRSDA
jgi:hypothetical protein